MEGSQVAAARGAVVRSEARFAPTMSSSPVTFLFTDLVNSTELLQRAGDEQAQRIFQAHHRLLKRCVAAHGGEEVKWLGDGLMTVFASPADALHAAVAMQQAARRRAAGERLAIRVGLHVGEALRDESDYFGTAVVIARRLCDQGQVVDARARLIGEHEEIRGGRDLGNDRYRQLREERKRRSARLRRDPPPSRAAA